jgi:serine/threonine protein kinase
MIGQCSSELLESALAGNLPADAEASLCHHLEVCEVCRAAMEQMAGGAAWCQEAASMLGGDELDDAVPVQDEWSEVDFTVEHLEPSDEPNVLGRLGGYDVLEIIGRGGMGVVLKAFDRELKRCVAIKVLAPHLAHNSLAKKRFAREAQAAAAVVHPHVLAIHHVQPNGRLPFLVMPLVAGESLAQRLKTQGTLELKEILRIGMQAAAGLGAAHDQGLVHRDVKPANILLEMGVERAVLTDFGLARAADDVSMTRWGIIAGTPQYMSPEQAKGESLDGRSDLFSLGCVLYEMATGVSPFRTDSAMATMRRLVDDSPQAMASLNPELPPWFIAIVDRLLEKDPSRRFNSAKEVSELLEGCLAHVQQPTSVPLPVTLPKPVAQSVSGWRSSRFKGVIAMFAILGIVLLGAFGILSSEPPDIAGEWSGEEWGKVVLIKTTNAEYTGTYTDTIGKKPGEIQLKWSRIERRFNGTWREEEDRFGELSVRLVNNEIRGALTTDAKSKINPATPRLADLTWIRAAAAQNRSADASVKLFATKNQVAQIEALLKKAPVTTKLLAELFEHDATSRSSYRLRSDVVSLPIMPAEKAALDVVPLGTVLYLPDSKAFYIQWDSAYASGLHYYGPFYGEPAAKLGLKQVSPEEKNIPGRVAADSGIELVALAKYPTKGSPWWKPDGSPLREAPVDASELDITSSRDPKVVWLTALLRVPGGLDWLLGSDYIQRVDGKSVVAGRQFIRGQPAADLVALAVAVPSDAKHVDLALRVAHGSWQSAATVGAANLLAKGELTQDGKVWHVKREGRDLILKVDNAPKDVQLRVAMNRKDQFTIAIPTYWQSYKGSAPARNEAWQFKDVSEEGIHSFLLQTRPYQKVEFRNVALQSDSKPPAEVAPSKATFGPVIERVIQGDGKDCWALNLASGKVVASTPNQPLDFRVGAADKLRAAKVDLYSPIEANTADTLIALDMRFVSLSPSPDDWNISASAAVAQMEKTVSVRKSEVFITGRKVFVFSTRDGVTGVLQIDESNENPQRVKTYIRYKLVQSGSKPPAEVAPSKATFRPVIERVLPSDVDCRHQYFQFRKGEIFVVGNGPSTTAKEFAEDRKKAEDAGGIDISVMFSEEGIHLVGEEGIFTQDMDNLKWDTTTAEKVVKGMKHARFTYGVVEPRVKDCPITYLFKTSRGEVGIMEILGVVEDKRDGGIRKGMKFRYKLVQNGQPSAELNPKPKSASTSLLATKDQVKQINNLIKLIGDAPVTANSLPKLFELTPGSKNEYQLRSGVLSLPIMPAEKSQLDFGPLGQAIYWPGMEWFYIQWDSSEKGTPHYYGPFNGKPAEKLGLSLSESGNAGAESSVPERKEPYGEVGKGGFQVPKIDQAEREAIVAAAKQAISKHLKAERKKGAPNEIGAAFWGEPISKLKPIRVRDDHRHVMIVLSVKDGIEEGLYVSNPVSSYAVTVGDRFALMTQLSTEKDRSFGLLYHYKLQPNAK